MKNIWNRVLSMTLATGLLGAGIVYGTGQAGIKAGTISPAATTASLLAGQKNTPQVTLTKAEETNAEAEAAIGQVVTEDQTVAGVTASAMPSMVTISTMSVVEMMSFFGGSQEYEAQGAGTGVIIGQNDTELLIATNNHVVEGAEQLSVGFIDEEAVEAAVKGTDPDTDLAVVSVKLEDIPQDTLEQIKIATIGDSDALVLGEQIVAIGNALGYGQSVTSGYVSAFGRELELSDGYSSFTSSDLIQVDAAINSGNSGGALLNMRGELVGINEAKSSMTSSGATVDNMGYAIPINKAEPILEDLMNEIPRDKHDDEDRGYLGVTCANVTEEHSQLYGMPEGVCFTSVTEGGPAAEAGLMKGDILVSMDGKSIKTYDRLTERLQYYEPGETVEIVVMRANNGEYEEKTVSLTLGSKDALEELMEEQGDN